jgi:hypothetical protein
MVTQRIGGAQVNATADLEVCSRENFLAVTANRNAVPIRFFDHSCRSLVTIPTELYEN